MMSQKNPEKIENDLLLLTPDTPPCTPSDAFDLNKQYSLQFNESLLGKIEHCRDKPA